MPDYKVVNATQLDSDMESLADSIRAKAGVAEKLAFPAGMKAAVDGIETGGGSDDVAEILLGAKAVDSYTIPSNITALPGHVFRGQSNIGEIIVPEGVESIGMYCFADIPQGKGVIKSLPETITSIGAAAFSGNLSVALTELPDGITRIEDLTFYSGYSNRTLEISKLPSKLVYIGDSAFRSRMRIKITEIPETVTTIGSNAFYFCSGLTSLTFKGTPTRIASNSFSQCGNLTVINVPWSEGTVANAPWGATKATINYDYTGE